MRPAQRAHALKEAHTTWGGGQLHTCAPQQVVVVHLEQEENTHRGHFDSFLSGRIWAQQRNSRVRHCDKYPNATVLCNTPPWLKLLACILSSSSFPSIETPPMVVPCLWKKLLSIIRISSLPNQMIFAIHTWTSKLILFQTEKFSSVKHYFRISSILCQPQI